MQAFTIQDKEIPDDEEYDQPSVKSGLFGVHKPANQHPDSVFRKVPVRSNANVKPASDPEQTGGSERRWGTGPTSVQKTPGAGTNDGGSGSGGGKSGGAGGGYRAPIGGGGPRGRELPNQKYVVLSHDQGAYRLKSRGGKIYAVNTPLDAQCVWLGIWTEVTSIWPRAVGERFDSIGGALAARGANGEAVEIRSLP